MKTEPMFHRFNQHPDAPGLHQASEGALVYYADVETALATAERERDELRALLREVQPAAGGIEGGNSSAWLDEDWWRRRDVACEEKP